MLRWHAVKKQMWCVLVRKTIGLLPSKICMGGGGCCIWNDGIKPRTEMHNVKIKIILNGTEELVAALEQKSKSDFVAVCNRTVGLLTREATRNTPADTGKLRQSIRTELPKESDTTINGAVGYTLHYAPHVEYGHRQQPGRFVPQIGKRLKASYVPGQRFLQRSVEAVRPQFEQMLKDELKED